jgi:hypothetical protein
MSTIEVIAVVVAGVWLATVTLVAILVVRQIALLTARLDHVATHTPSPTLSLANEGPKIGSRIDDAILRWVPDLGATKAHLLLLSSTCGPCREFAANVRAEDLPLDRPLVVLIPGSSGREELADGLERMLPTSVTTVRDPKATDIAQLLEMQMVPSAITTMNGSVAAKLPIIETVDQFLRFVGDTTASVPTNGSSPFATQGAAHGR